MKPPVCAIRALAMILLALAAGCDISAEHPALNQGTPPPLLQAHRFAYHGAVHGGYQLSPDGRKLAWIGPSFVRKALFVRDNASGEVHKYPARSASFHWTPDGRRLLYENDVSGAENTHVYVLDTDDPAADAVDLTPYPGVRAGIHRIVSGSGHVLVYHNRRDRNVFDLYRIDLNTREETLAARNPGDGVAPVTAGDGTFKGWEKSRDSQRSPEERRQPLTERRPTLLKKPEETFRVLGMSADRSFVWALSDRGRDRIALVAAHPTLGWEKIVFEDPHADVRHVVMSRVTRAPLIALAQPGYPRVAILDSKLRDDLGGLLKEHQEGEFGMDIVSADNAEQHLIVSIYTDVQRRYYLVDRANRRYTLLAEDVEPELAATLARVRPITIMSRDGMQLHGYLTLPRGVEPKRLPMVLLVHGGPWMRTGWGNPMQSGGEAIPVQFLANRGYAVLQVDFRGSVGYGRRFLTAAMGEFAGKMQEDLLDSVRWAVDGGIADADRVAVVGWSYGGYAALIGLATSPKMFACGVSIGGPTDLATLIESFPPYWKTDLSMWHDYVGNPGVAEDREEMTRKSPLPLAHNIERPVLIVHGAKDVRVRIDQAERMVQALRRAGKPVEYVAIEDMGHNMGYWAHWLEVLRKTENFLHRCLGGRASRFDPFDAIAWVWTRIQ